MLVAKVMLECVALSWCLMSYLAGVSAQTTTTLVVEERTYTTNDDYIQLLSNQRQQQQQLRNISADLRLLSDNLKASFQSMEQLSCSDKQQQTSQQNLPSSLKESCIPLLIQQRLPHGDPLFFNRSWAEFKVGMNNSNGNYWLGNEMLHQLTKDGTYKLRIEFQLTSGVWHWAEYSRFVVHGEASNYLLDVAGFTGTAGDALRSQNRRMFSTWDRDNDVDNTANCANRGGFWYTACGTCCVNQSDWFKWHNSSTWLDLQSSRMWLMCR